MYSTLGTATSNDLYKQSNKNRADSAKNNKRNEPKGIGTIRGEKGTDISVSFGAISPKIRSSSTGAPKSFRSSGSHRDGSIKSVIIVHTGDSNLTEWSKRSIGGICSHVQRASGCYISRNQMRGASKSLKSQPTSRFIVLSSVLIHFVCAMSILFALSGGGSSNGFAEANVLMRVCDTREIKTVTSRVCMLYKRTKNSDVKLDKEGNLRITRSPESDNDASGKGDYSPAKLATECCKIGCPPHYFAYNC